MVTSACDGRCVADGAGAEMTKSSIRSSVSARSVWWRSEISLCSWR
jgi:hypothetical protein